MVAGESPAVARRRVRLALRAARDAKGLTQGFVAEELDWSLSKVNRIEKGDVTVSRTDLLAMLELYDVTDQALIADLIQAVRTSRQRSWWDEPSYREHMTPALRRYFEFEGQATAIRVFQITMVPGVLQTPAYAGFVMDFWRRHGLSERDSEVRLSMRLRRRAHVFGRSDAPQYLLILDESVLYREFGGAAIMADQLRELISASQDPRIITRVVPYSEAAPLAMLGPFAVLDLGGDENAVLYRESHLIDEIVEARDEIDRHRHIFEELWGISYSEEESMRLIEARAATMRSSLDRRPPAG